MSTTVTRVGRQRLLGANRDFTLLWSGLAISALGSGSCAVAYPLLVLALTHSAGQVGLVMAAGVVVRLAIGLPGGVFVDRVDKRRLMLVCVAGVFGAQAVLVAGVVGHWLSLWLLVLLQVVEGVFGSVFGAAEETAVRHVVRADQLPLALARNEARGAAAMLAGPPLGGLMFAFLPALPFAVNAVSSLASFVCIASLRAPMPPALTRGRSTPSYGDLLDGLSWLWRRPFFRTTLLLVSGLNLASNAVFLLAVVSSGERGDPATATGTLVMLASVGSLVGALLAPKVVARLSVRTILVANRLVWVAVIPLLVFVANPYVVGGLIAAMFVIGPTGSTALTSRQMALTPEEFQGRASSARGFMAGLAAPIGIGLAGLCLDQLGRTASILALTGWMIAMTLLAALSRAIRAEASTPVTAPTAKPGGMAKPG